MFRIAICDDEQYFREQITEMLQQYMKEKGIYYEIHSFRSGRELLELGIELNQYQIIFLDINMDEIDGLLTAQKIREHNKEIFIVFVTAFVNYSIDGYKVDAIRFLLKSNKNMQEHITECMDAIHQKMQYEVARKEFVFCEGKRKISLDQILYVESKLHKLELHIMEEEMVVRTMYDTLNNLEAYVGNRQFLRCHQSFLVNMKYIKSVCRYEVVLYNNKKLPIPKAKFKEIYDAYVVYKGEI
ncbi:MAG: response regulator transcription factor [Lachnospiraceae bacterium]|nr:response regulator transcription factor [Lachnospiraceae bacterium]